jgi:hypothetical protein
MNNSVESQQKRSYCKSSHYLSGTGLICGCLDGKSHYLKHCLLYVWLRPYRFLSLNQTQFRKGTTRSGVENDFSSCTYDLSYLILDVSTAKFASIRVGKCSSSHALFAYIDHACETSCKVGRKKRATSPIE